MKVLYYLGRTHHSVKYAFTGLLLFASLVPSFSQITQTFTTDGTFTVPAGVTSITVEAWGGGGSGGGYTGIIRGGGGGGGAYSRSSLTVTPSSMYGVTVGLGATCCGGDGQPGGTSSFAGVVVAGGGGGGIAGDLGGSGGAGGSGFGDVTFSGGAGGNGAPFSGGGGGSSAGTNSAGMSGSESGFPGFAPSGGGNGGWGVSSGPAENGQLPGGGGGGTGDPGSGSFGADGKVIISYTLPPPSAFIVGSILTTGGNVVANFWNGTNIGVDIFVPIGNDPNLLNGTVQIQGKVGAGSFSNIGGTFTISAINTTKVVTLSDVVFESIPGFVDGAQIFVTAIITQGAAPFLSTTGTQSATTLTVDQTAPSAPLTPDLSAASDTGGFNTDNITNDLTPDFTISGTTAGNTYKIYSSLDPGIRGSQVSGGGNITIFTALVSQGNHSITVTQTDVAGNTSSSSSSLNVTLDTAAPTIISITFNASFSPAMDPSFNNCNGGAVTNTSTREYVHLITSEPLNLPDGFYVSGWSASDGPLDISCSTAGGASVYHGPNTIHLKSDLDNSWSGATLYNYNGSGNNFDYAGNQMQSGTFCACDLTPPQLASGMVFDPNGSGSENIKFTVGESLNTTTVANGVTGLSVNGTPFAGTYNTLGNTVTINSGVNGLWTSAATVSYSGGNLIDPFGNAMVAFGPEPIFLAPVSIFSNNANPSAAKIGDVITVFFTAARTLISAPVVTIGGNAATVSGSFPVYSANITATAGMVEGPINFSITADEASKSTVVSVTTDGSSVIFDKTAPTAPGLPDLSPISDTGAPTDNITSQNSGLNFSGTAENNSTVALYDGLTLIATTTANGSGAWTATTVGFLLDGLHSITVKATDAAGNISAQSVALSVIIDTSPPIVSSIVRSSTIKGFGTSTNPIAASSVDFLVTFTEANTPLSGINGSDFFVAMDPGLSGATVTSVTGSGSSRTVQVSGITGTGRISLGVNDDDTILDAAGNPLGGVGVNNGAVTPSFTASQFYTIVLPEPTASVNTISQSTTLTSVTVTWNDAVAPVQQATNYYVRLKKSTSSFSPATFAENTNDGADYTDTDFLDGALGSYVAYDALPTTGTVTFTGLTSGTLYNIEIYPLTQTANYGVVNWDYKFTAPLTGNAATISAVSDIIKESTFTYPTDILYVSSNNQVSDITTVTGVSLERFKIRDGGGSADADGLSTLLSSVTLRVTNYQYLKRLALYEVGASPGFASNVEIAELNVASTATNISGNVADFIFSGITTFSAPDNSENNFVVKATFNSLGIMDNSVISFAVVALSNGAVSSIFANTAPTGVASSVSGNQNKIEVVTTRLDYTSFPAAGGLNLNFGPVVIEARDINANLDLDFVSPVSAFSNTDALGMINTPFTPNPILSFNGGILTLPVNFQFTSSPATPPTQLSISAGGILNQLSPTFDIVSTFESQIKTDPSYIFSTNINYINFQAANIQPVDITGGIGSFELDRVLLSDGDADGLAGDTDGAATVLTSLTLQLTNYGHIKSIALYNSGSPGATELAELPGSNFNGSGQITFSGLNIVAPDEGTTPISIRVSFNSNSSTITDNSLIRLSIAAAVAGSGSQFRNDPGFIGGVSGGLMAPVNVNLVNVSATKLRFTIQPSNTLLGVSMNPAVVIEAADANDVRDVSVGSTISVTSTGTLSGSPQSVVFASGVGIYSGLVHTSTGTGLTLSTNSGPLTNATSTTFNITTSNASDISVNSGFSYPQNILHTSFQEAANIANTATSLMVAKFDIRDGGVSLTDSDVAPTILTALSLNLGSNFGFIRRIALYDALGTTEISGTEQAISAQTVNFTGLNLTAADNTLLSFTVRVSFTTTVVDNQQFSFTVSAASTQAANSSAFALATAGAAASSTAGNNNRINILPVVSSIVKSSSTNAWSTTNGTSATSANFTVTFSESVTGVDDTDFTLTATGTVAGVKGTVTGGPSVYTVPVNTITGTGTLRLDFTSNGTVIDLFTVANTASFATGGVGGTYSIVLPEPANQVTSVSATAVSSTQSRVDWTNAVAGQLPTHLLILAKRTGVGTYASVADGALVTAEEDFSNNNGAAIVSLLANPTQTSYTFSNMVSTASYDFVVYPYTLSANNTSDNTDYKIGSNPTATVTLSFLTIASLNSGANGVAASPLPANSTSQAVFGFSMVSTGTQLVSRINIRTSSTSIGKLSNYKLVESSDNDFSTTGDNADISGTFTPSPTGVLISGLAESISTLKNYFLTADVNVAMNGATTPIQNSFTEVDVLVGSGVINSGTVTGTNYLFISSQNSDIVFTTGTSSNILYGSFQSSTGLTTGNTAPLATFQIRDGAGDADNQNTVLNGLTLQFGNFANLRRVALFDGVTNVAEQDVTGDLVTFTGFSLTAPEASIKSFSVRGTFKTTVTDNQFIQVSVFAATAANTGSGFASSDAGGAATSGSVNKIVVTADRLYFASPPATVLINQNFGLTVNSVDVNNNADLDYGGTVTLSKFSGPGVFSSTDAGGLSRSLSSGSVSWSQLQISIADVVAYTIRATLSGLTSADLLINALAPAGEPTTQTSALTFSAIGLTSVSVNYTNGDGVSRVLLAKSGSSVDANPVDGTGYSSNTIFGSGPQLGTGNYIVGTGSGPITITGLTSGVTYFFRAYEFNGSSGSENYNTNIAPGNPASVSTLATPTITSFDPTSGGIGAVVTITGTNFDPAFANNAVKFSGTTAVATASTNTSITTTVPTGATTGKITVTVNGITGTSSTNFTVIPAPTISNFNPTSGVLGAPVTITGTNFDTTPANNAVKFNGTSAIVTGSTVTSITTSVPSGATTGTITVTVGGQTATSTTSFTITIVPLPTISSFTPSGGVGSTITISGTEFTGATAVSFGGTNASSFNVVSATSITAVVAAGASGSVSVTTPGGTATKSGFTFILVPTISSFIPTSAASGSSITIDGINFTGATTVSFGGTAATSFSVVSATSITAVVSSGASGSVSITTPEGTATKSGFTFIPAPTILSFTPAGGVGSTITITGTDFTGATAVSFGGTAATSFNVVSITSITAVVASGTSGSVSVTTPGGTATKAGFTFVLPPTISSFTPIGGTGSTITITGTDFTGATAVSFGGTSATSFAVGSATSITAVVATGTSGSVSVTTPGGTATKAGFIFVLAPTISSFTLSGGTGATITIIGTNFTGATAVSFGGAAAASFNVVSATSITAVVAAGTSGTVTVTTPGGIATSAGFVFIAAPTIISFTPSGVIAGATITITGTNFIGATAVSIGGVVAASFNVVSATSITAVVASGASGAVTVTTPGGIATKTGFTFIIDTTPPVLASNNTVASISTGSALTFNVTYSDVESTVTGATVEYRVIEIGGTPTPATMVASGNNWIFSLPVSTDFGVLGMEYRFKATNSAGLSSSFSPYYTLQVATTSVAGLTIPFTVFGTKTTDYRIFSVPLELNNPTLGDVLSDDLGGSPDIKKWRAAHYETASKETVYLNASSPIGPGKGYWLLIKDNTVTLDTGPGKTVNTNSENTFTIELKDGWNQIGNPYNFDVNWNDVQAANPTVGKLMVWNGSYAEGSLKKYEGGFVKVTGNVSLKIPVIKGGRTTYSSDVKENPIDEIDWKVIISVKQSNMQYNLGGVGMSPKASKGFDVLDNFTLPRLNDYLEFNHNRKVGGDFYSSDIVPTEENHQWEFSIDSNLPNEPVYMSWDNSYFGNGDKVLVLEDLKQNVLVNMSERSAYSFPFTKDNRFRILYGSLDYVLKETLSETARILSVSPNPSDGQFTVDYAVPNGKEQPVTISILDLMGKTVGTVANKNHVGGFYKANWETSPAEPRLAGAIYLIQLKTNKNITYQRIIMR